MGYSVRIGVLDDLKSNGAEKTKIRCFRHFRAYFSIGFLRIPPMKVKERIIEELIYATLKLA